MKNAVVACVAGAALATAAPAAIASAGVRPDDRAGPRGAGVTSLSTSLRPDDRAGPRGVGGGPSEIALGSTRSAPATGNGFDWSAAGVGAAAATVVVALLGWALTLRRGNRRAEASA
jgi:hypothetical protein